VHIEKSLLAAICIFLAGCGSQDTVPEGPRTILLNGIEEPLTENEDVSFETWMCYELRNANRVLLEVGILKGFEGVGFILFNGTNRGTATFYSKNNTLEGIEHRWAWELNQEGTYDYEFILNTGSNGLFYSHGTAEEANSANPRIFKCQQ